MTSPKTTTGWNATTTARNFTYYNQATNSLHPDPLHGNLTREEMLILRNQYYDSHYDYRTGLRIAGTLGGFFLFVLLTLLYKSRCKKHSRPPTPVPLPPLLPYQEDPPTYLGMRQVHPLNHYPTFLTSPALLLTPAHSESSEEDSPLAKPLLFPRATLSPPGGRMKWLQQAIDIHVILPTPTISPSGSEHFCPREGVPSPLLTNNNNSGGSRRGSGLGADRDRSSSVGSSSVSYAAGGGAYGGNPLCFLDNLKYVDDTSSENIPTIENEEPDQDTRSIGSDSVFATFETNFDHVAPGYGGRRVSSVSGYGGGDEGEVKLTLTQAQVHHRDSFCSEVESVNDYLESHRRRSSSTQTTFSDLQQCLSLSCASGGQGNNGGSPHLSPRPGSFKQGASLHPNRPVPSPALLSVGSPGNSPMGRGNFPRKRSFEALRKTHSLQCDEPISCSTITKPAGK